jgi:hypothetical protein
MRHPVNILTLINNALTTQQSFTDDTDMAARRASCVVPLLVELIVKSSGRFPTEPAGLILQDFPVCKEALDDALCLLLDSKNGNGKFPLV